MSRCKLLKVPRACLFVCLAFVLFSCGFCLCVFCVSVLRVGLNGDGEIRLVV